MATWAEINSLANKARCWGCVPRLTQAQVQAYILAQIAGLALDASTLAQLAKCLHCVNPQQLLEMKAYLLANLAGVPTDAQSLTDAALCYECIPRGMLLDVESYLWSLDPASPSADRDTLIALAKGFQGLGPLSALAIQVYALAVKAGVSTDKDTLAGLSKCMRCLTFWPLQTVNTYVLDIIEYGGGTPPPDPGVHSFLLHDEADGGGFITLSDGGRIIVT